MDTCHVFVAGYDLRNDYDAVIESFERIIGLRHLRLFHLNDSVGMFRSRRDRHADIGTGALGEAPFRRIMSDPRFAEVPKVLETPKGERQDRPRADLQNLARRRSYLNSGAGRLDAPTRT